jgi:hypothetical protein
MIKVKKIPNEPVLDFVIGISIFAFVSDFDIRISDFTSLASWVLNFVDVVLLNI